jgi:hypothetical protein
MLVTATPIVRLGFVDPRERSTVTVRAIGGNGRLGPPACSRVGA